MVANPKLRINTREEFEQFAAQPENRDRRLEFIDGEVVEVVANEISVHITALLSALITVFVHQHQLGYTTSAEGGFRIGADDMMPDCAFISKAKREKPKGETWITVIPDLVLEVKSPTDSKRAMRRKAESYLAAGVRLVWLVFPEDRLIEIYDLTMDDVTIVGADGVLAGGDVLPGFTVNLSDLFDTLS